MPTLFRPTLLARPAAIALGLALPAGLALAADPPKTPDAAAAPAEAPKDPVIATVNGTQIHLADIFRLFGGRANQIPYENLVDNMVNTTLIAQAAKAQNLGDDAEVKAKVALLQNQVLAQAYVERLQKKAVTPEAEKAKYDQMVADKALPEQAKARHILVKTEAEAKAIIAQLGKGADFAKLANEKSTDPSVKESPANAGGELGWFTKDKMVPEFSEAAFKLKPGEYTKTPVKSQFGYHVIQLEETRVEPLEDAKQEIDRKLAGDTIDAAIKDLSAKAKIEKFGPDGKPLPAKTEAAPPPGTPAAPATAGAAPATPPKPADPAAKPN